MDLWCTRLSGLGSTEDFLGEFFLAEPVSRLGLFSLEKAPPKVEVEGYL